MPDQLSSPEMHRGKALVVDDEPVNRLILQAYLNQEGYQVITAVNGQQAVDVFIAEGPDIIFMDVMMPVLDGYQATRQIKQLSGARFVPIIFLTSITDEEELARCVEVGGDDFLSKPFSRTVLNARINAIERIRDLHRTVQRQHDILLHDEQMAEAIFSDVVMAHNVQLDNMQVMLKPAVTFSGDLMLSAKSPNGEIYVLLGDFTGHGLAAAIGAFPVSQTFRTMTGKGFAPAHILREINNKLCEILPADMFFAACLICILPDTKSIAAWNGGLPDALIYRPRAGQVIQQIPSSHLALGILSMQEPAEVDYFEVEQGDQILLLTDGVIEAADANNQQLGESALMKALGRTDLDAFAVITDLLENHTRDVKQLDDISLVVLACQHISGANETISKHMEDRYPQQSAGQAELYTEWSWSFELGPALLRELDPVPIILSQLAEIKELREHRQALFTILAELYNNALDHGILQLDSSMKVTAEGFAAYFEQREARLNKLTDGRVSIQLVKKSSSDGVAQLCITVEDSGQGFDYQTYRANLRETSLPAGRGIRIVEELCESLTYNERGNCVSAVFAW